jgi:phage gp29-like protein
MTKRRRNQNVVELAARRKPGRTIITALPQDAISSWTFASINRTLDAHELGDFSRSALLAEAFGRDDRISACLNTRVQAILGRHGADFSIEPSDRGDQRRAKAIAKDVESWWTDAITEKAESRILRDRTLLGVSISRIEWTARDGRWLPIPRPWPMQYVCWDENRRCYMVQAQEGQYEVRPGDPNWLISALSDERPWMDGAIRSLGLPFLLRSFSSRDWARFNERHGMPIIAIEEPADANEADKAAFFDGMKNIGRNGVVRLPQQSDATGGKGNGFKVSFIEATATAWETFKAFGERLEVAIAVRLLGQNLTTEVQGGSYAAATVHDRVRQDYMDFDAEGLSTDLRDGLLKPWVAFHYPPSVSPEAAPWPCWNTDAPEDRTSLADTGVKAGEAIAKFRELGLRVDLDTYLERLGIPMLPGEAIEEPEDEPTPPAAPPNPEEPSDGPDEEDEAADEPEGGETTASVRLASGDALASAQGFVDGQRYADDLAHNAAGDSVQAMAPALDLLMTAIEASDTPEELRANLAEAYRGMSQAEMETLVERALIMAELAGRHAVIEDL